jgi:molybdopterin molybdotransferase
VTDFPEHGSPGGIPVATVAPGPPDRGGPGDCGDPDRVGAPDRGAIGDRGRPDPVGFHRQGVPFSAARRIAQEAVTPLAPRDVPVSRAAGQVLATPLAALCDLPAFDTSAMDGWAVAGTGPWRLAGEVLAGQRAARALGEHEGVRIATGAGVPVGADAVVRREDGRIERRGAVEWLRAARTPVPGQDIRPRGQECIAGDELLAAGTVVTPAIVGLAAAAGYDELAVVPRPRVDVLVLGDELLDGGLPRDGRVRDALGPLLPPWLTALGADVAGVRSLGDDADLLRQAIGRSTADLVITTGGTAAGPVDFVHPVLRGLDARLLVDGVAIRPGHPMLLARLPSGRPLVGLPGNPLAAVSAMLTLAAPLLRTLAGRPQPPPGSGPFTAVLSEEVAGHPRDTRLVPVVLDRAKGTARPLRFHGPAMLRGLASADAMAVIAPGGAPADTTAEILPLGW